MSETSSDSIAQVRAKGIPWLVWANVIASVSIATGLYWDISWHETIGRDSFWTPAHLLIPVWRDHSGTGLRLVIMRTTFAGDPTARQNSVGVLGLRGPLGAFIAAWEAAPCLPPLPLITGGMRPMGWT